MHSSVGSILLVILQVHGATSVELPPMRTFLADGGWGVAKVRTVAFAENRNSREPLYFPMTMASVLLYQICADSLVITTDPIR